MNGWGTQFRKNQLEDNRNFIKMLDISYDIIKKQKLWVSS